MLIRRTLTSSVWLCSSLGFAAMVAAGCAERTVAAPPEAPPPPAAEPAPAEPPAPAAPEGVPAEPGPTGAMPGPGMPGMMMRDLSEARSALSQLRCERMHACGEIGPARRYVSMESCMSDVRQELDMNWSESACRDRIESSALDACLDQVRGLACEEVTATAATSRACSRDAVCRMAGG